MIRLTDDQKFLAQIGTLIATVASAVFFMGGGWIGLCFFAAALILIVGAAG